MKRLILFILFLIMAGGLAAFYVVPWNEVLQLRITAFLNSRGLQNIAFEIDHVGLHEATFKNIKIGQETPLLLQSVAVQYDPKELVDGNLRDLSLTGIDIKAVQTDEGWKIAGLEDIRQKTSPDRPAMTFSELVEILPFTSVEIKDSNLHIEGKSVQVSLPFNMRLTKAPETSLEMTINATSLAAAQSDVSLGIVNVKAEPDETGNWSGSWTLESLDFGEALPVPVLSGSGHVKYAGDAISFDGGLKDKANTHKASFTTLINIKAAEKNTLTVSSVSFPFKGGMVSSKNIIVPFDRSKNITINLNVNKVSLDALMQTLTGERVTATGTVSGSMPVILKPDGSYTLGKGTLKANDKGLIRMPGEIIPGDNAQVGLVREILENLHYSLFSASVNTSGGKGMIVRLSLEGNNPDVYGGRAVKLNVNLTGDVLDFIQQNAMLITNPERLLRQGTP